LKFGQLTELKLVYETFQGTPEQKQPYYLIIVAVKFSGAAGAINIVGLTLEGQFWKEISQFYENWLK